MKENLSKSFDQQKMQEAITNMQNALRSTTGVQWQAMEQQMEMQKSFQNNPEIIAINQRVQEACKKKAEAYAPEMARCIFKLLDLDKSGKISSRELNVLKALMDGFLRLGTSSLISGDGAAGQA